MEMQLFSLKEIHSYLFTLIPLLNTKFLVGTAELHVF